MNALDAAFSLVHDQPGGAGPLSVRMGKAQGTLAQELRGYGTAKLGLMDAVKISVMTGDLRILNAFAEAMGCSVLPMAAEASGSPADVLTSVARVSREFADLVACSVAADADGRVSANELDAAEAEWADLVRSGQALMQHLRARHQAGKPAHVLRAEAQAQQGTGSAAKAGKVAKIGRLG